MQDIIYEVLSQIENGSLYFLNVPKNRYSGNVDYYVNNGWKITVFIDFGKWDYIDKIVLEDGTSIDFESLEEMPKITNYYPSNKVLESVYKVSSENFNK
ncbi:hypothetical protein [Bernardetia sp.]|uniref:hypothetical protein n=1 Tax=Bernardetia sp. TaxID=1937974 RepID=UPI0025C4BF43|nr:hypothetical protein [Bernardetia sp.]